jgi:hypothetical protein
VTVVLVVALRSESGWRSRPISIALRLASVALLVAALARPVTIWRADDVATIVVRDVSDSVPRGEDAAIDRFLAAEVAAARARRSPRRGDGGGDAPSFGTLRVRSRPPTPPRRVRPAPTRRSRATSPISALPSRSRSPRCRPTRAAGSRS